VSAAAGDETTNARCTQHHTSSFHSPRSFRELYVFDATMANVALFKSASASVASYTDPVLGITSLPSYGVDGSIDMDNITGAMVNLGPCDGTAWWQVRVHVDLHARVPEAENGALQLRLTCFTPPPTHARRWTSAASTT